MKANPEVVIIPKEDAVFWLDAEGRWQNEHGPFEHPKVSAYFHTCIAKDEKGYYLGQQRDAVYEKVYFPYEDTALFVIRVESAADKITCRLNTSRRIRLDPADLYVKDDHLYLHTDLGPARFNQQSLMKISNIIEEENGDLFIKVGGERFKIEGEF